MLYALQMLVQEAEKAFSEYQYNSSIKVSHKLNSFVKRLCVAAQYFILLCLKLKYGTSWSLF